MKRKVYSPNNSTSWRHPATPKSGARRKRWPWKKIILYIVLIGFIGSGAVFIWASRDLPTPEGIVRRTVPQSTKIYDRTGETVLYDIHGTQRRTSVELKDIPLYLQHATLTAEDRSFYEHKGFKFTSMIRSLLVNIVSGDKAQGGSTITQQFIKNAIVGGEKSYLRKIKEVILAYQIERKFSKDEILKLYFNEIPYGSNAYGAQAAAQMFFGKDVSNLSLAESAILAAIPKAPTYFSPWGSHIDELIARQQYIIGEMVNEGYISEEEAAAAKTEKLSFVEKQENIIAPHFVFYIRELLAEKYGEKTVEQGGLKIITTLDLKKQKAAEEAIAASEEKNKGYKAQNAALTAIDTKTGQIVAMVGSRDYFNDEIAGQVNVALRPRQPGSSFKPIVYTKAFEKGYTPETILFDVVTTFKTDTKDYTPHNYNDKENGPVSLRQALAGSLNIPAVKILYLTGIDNVLNLADTLGYTTLHDRSRFGLSLVLGGAEVKLLEHTNAFATLAREGVYKPTYPILKVTDPTGTTLEEYKDNEERKVLEPQITRETSSVLSDNNARAYIFGQNNYLTLGDRPVAAKTGTTNDYRDAWTLGYTPSLAAGVWVGNSDNSEMKRGADGSVVAAPIWQSFMSKALAGTAVENFTPPEPVSVNNPMVNGFLSGSDVLIDRASGKLATNLTPPSFVEKRRYRQYHTILYYINKDNPLGDLTTNPTSDPQFENWEAAVRRWSQAQGLYDESPPTDFDDLHIPENVPSLNIMYPSEGQTVSTNPTTFTINAFARRGINRAAYYIDNQFIGESKIYPFSLNLTITDELTNGFHRLRVVAFDDIDNSASAESNFNLLTTPVASPFSFNWASPNNNDVFSVDSGSTNLSFNLNNPGQIKKIDLYYKINDGQSNWFGVIENIQTSISTQLAFKGVGDYSVYLILTDNLGITKTSKPINFRVE